MGGKSVGTIAIKKESKKNRLEIPSRMTRMFNHSRKTKTVSTKTLESCENIKNKKLYFLDVTALIHYAGPLYGVFLVKDQFDSKCIMPGEDNIFITDEQTLTELQELEERKEEKIYKGYKAFVERNLIIVSAEEAIWALQGENLLTKEFGQKIVVEETEDFAHTIGSLYYLYHKNLEPILVTSNARAEEIARERGFEIYNIS